MSTCAAAVINQYLYGFKKLNQVTNIKGSDEYTHSTQTEVECAESLNQFLLIF